MELTRYLKISRRRPYFILLSFLILLYAIRLTSHGVLKLLSSHSYDLSYTSIFRAQFEVYILTHDCRRFTADIASHFESVVLVPDVVDSPYCKALKQKSLYVDTGTQETRDDIVREKYAQVLEHCRDGQKMKCVILEDDIVLLHNLRRTREVLVENTLSLFNDEKSAFDCTKRGFGWFKTTPTGNGSQCRIFSKPTTSCLSQCLRRDPIASREQLDYGVRDCQMRCGLAQKRFLLAVHGGLSSTMDRQHN